jgi:hypothetical protein
VRRTTGKSFPQTDGLQGTAPDAGVNLGPTGNSSFTVNFEDATQFKFATGDGTKWMIMTREDAIGLKGAPQYYANQDRLIQSSHTSPTPYYAKMYHRASAVVDGDPWITWADHSWSTALYIGGSFNNYNSPGLSPGDGLNVFAKFGGL